jgi:septum formation protein
MINPQSTRSKPPFLILASNSPRRRELLAEAGYQFAVMPPDQDVECGVCSESGPSGLVAELAFRKAAAVVNQLSQSAARELVLGRWPPGSLVIAADTVAECDGMILGKPRDEAEARAMLKQLSGREHRVLSGVCLWPLDLPYPLGAKLPLVRVAVTRLRMDRFSDAQLEDYLGSGQWEGKAGAFGYQDRLGWVHVIDGSESNVVGLPLETLAEMLAELAETNRQ